MNSLATPSQFQFYKSDSKNNAFPFNEQQSFSKFHYSVIYFPYSTTATT